MTLRNAYKDLLKRLENGPKTTKHFTHNSTDHSHMSVHFERYLFEMERIGLVVAIEKNNDILWHISEHGRKALANKPVLTPVRKIVAGTSEGIYDGKELLNTCMRPGAYDFLKYPSKFDQRLVYPKGVTV